jgi:hypothetical protein
MRSLKNTDTPVIGGYQIFHNYVRQHMALDGRTPAEATNFLSLLQRELPQYPQRHPEHNSRTRYNRIFG